jgi:hypothetical protein
MSIGSPLVFVCCVARVKSIEVECDIDQEPLAFYADKHVGSVTTCAFGNNLLASIEDTLLVGRSFTEHQYAQKH